MMDLDIASSCRTAGMAGAPGPLRDGRPYGRSRKQQHGIHPYSRPAQRLAFSSKEPLAAAINGNGQISILTKGADGAEPTVPVASLTEVHQLLQRVAAGEIDPAFAASHLASASHQAAADEASPDAWSEGGTPAEIVWAPGRSATQVAIALQRAAQECGKAMAARVTPQAAEEISKILPEATYHPAAAALVVTADSNRKQQRLPGTVAIIGGGPEEEIAAEEAKIASAVLGCYAYRLAATADGGAVPNLAAAQSAAVVIVLAQEGGVQPAVVAGLTHAPVIAVPSADGSTPSAPGVSTVGAGNGIAAAVFAARILQAASRLGGGGKK